MRVWHFISRLWKEDKLLFVSLALVTSLAYPMTTWGLDEYRYDGWRTLLYPALIIYALFRLFQIARVRLDRAESTTADEAKRQASLFLNTPEGSKQFDELIAGEYAKDEARRTTLWAEAASSARAARQLKKAIQDDLQANDDIMRDMLKRRPDDKAAIQDIALRRKEIEQELARVRDLIQNLHR